MYLPGGKELRGISRDPPMIRRGERWGEGGGPLSEGRGRMRAFAPHLTHCSRTLSTTTPGVWTRSHTSLGGGVPRSKPLLVGEEVRPESGGIHRRWGREKKVFRTDGGYKSPSPLSPGKMAPCRNFTDLANPSYQLTNVQLTKAKKNQG